MKKLGIDVSTWQGAVDWNRAQAAGVEFAIIRCGFGNDDSNQDDTQFKRNIDECKRLGIEAGVYLYSYATNTDMAVSEAKHVLRLINGYHLEYPVYLDVEDATQSSLSGDQMTSIILTFASVIENAGYWCGIYSMASWFGWKITKAVTDKLTTWCAQWGTGESSVACDIWQFTDSLAIAGAGSVDGNYSYRDFPSEIAGSKDTKPAKPIAPTAPQTQTYTVKSGDTLSSIAAKFGTTYQHLAAINGISNPDVIYAGQSLSISGLASSTSNLYVVKNGDTLSGIAQEHGTTYQKLAAANGIANPDMIYPGQVITI